MLDVSDQVAFESLCEALMDNQVYVISSGLDVTGSFSQVSVLTSLGAYSVSPLHNTDSIEFTMPSEIITRCRIHQCVNGTCIIEEDVIYEDEEVIVDNNTIIIRDSVTTIKNSSIIFNQHSQSQPLIIVDGGKIELQNSTLTYNIENLDVYNSITDGQSVIIIETMNGGEIIGSFDNVELITPPGIEDCRRIEAKVE